MVRLLLRPELSTLLRMPVADRDTLARSTGAGRFGRLYRQGNTVGDTIRTLERLRNDDEVGTEAQIRLATVQFMLGQVEDALDVLNAVDLDRVDRYVRNLALLTEGFALDHQKRGEDAADAYRAATAALPSAKASATLLAAKLMSAGRAQEASRVIERIAAEPYGVGDPWSYPNDVSYLERSATARLRELLGYAPTDPGEARDGPMPSEVRAGGESGVSQEPTAFALPVFSATRSGVSVEVSVTARNRPVTDLTAEDFELLDEGVPQRVQAAALGAVPLDVSLVLDVSDPVTMSSGEGAARFAPARSLDDLRAVFAALRPDVDRVRVSLINIEPFELMPIQRIGANRVAPGIPAPWQFGWTAALYDGVARTLLCATPHDRRHVVLLYTDGIDGTSALSAADLKLMAVRSDAVLHVARRTARMDPSDSRSFGFFVAPQPHVIEEVARSTGGRVYHPADRESMANAFIETLERYRSSYLLMFQPDGVTTDGWHELKVRVKRPGRYEVRARRGYNAG
jgi:hypothetical protein